MSHGMEDGELGIATTDSFAAARRFREKNGFERQARWSVSYLDGRSVGTALVFLVIGGVVVGVLEPSARLPAFAIAVAAPVVVLICYVKSIRRAEQRRDQQLAEFRAAQKADAAKTAPQTQDGPSC